MGKRDAPIGPKCGERLLTVHEMRKEMLADEIEERGKDSPAAKNLQRQIDAHEAGEDDDDHDHFHIGMIKDVKAK